MNDSTLPLTIVLLFVTSIMIILYYRQISKVNEECEEAEDAVSDITIGFSRKMKKQDNKISVVNERVE